MSASKSTKYKMTIISPDGKESRTSSVMIHNGLERFAQSVFFDNTVKSIRLVAPDNLVYNISAKSIFHT